MTPAIQRAKKEKIAYTIHEYIHDPDSPSYGEEAAEKLGVDANRIMKTLVVAKSPRELFVAVVPVARQLNLKLLAKATGAKKMNMADKDVVQRVTGYVIGGVSPIGQKKRLPTVIDDTARDFETVFISGGRRGLDMELAPQDLARLTGGWFAKIC